MLANNFFPTEELNERETIDDFHRVTHETTSADVSPISASYDRKTCVEKIILTKTKFKLYIQSREKIVFCVKYKNTFMESFCTLSKTTSYFIPPTLRTNSVRIEIGLRQYVILLKVSERIIRMLRTLLDTSRSVCTRKERLFKRRSQTFLSVF